MIDPFDSIPAARPEECDVRKRRSRVRQTVDLVAKPKAQKADFNPRQRDWFRRNGWVFARVETYNLFGVCNVDLWGFADYLAAKPGEGVLLVQVCRRSDVSTRLKKARSKPELEKWLAAGGRFAVYGWDQPDGPGGRWRVKVEEVQSDG